MPPYSDSAAKGSIYNYAHNVLYNFPLNQPALWAEPIVRREAHER